MSVRNKTDSHLQSNYDKIVNASITDVTQENNADNK